MNPGQFAMPRTQGGMPQPSPQFQPVPSAAKAAAYEAWAAQGGGIRESGRLPGKFRHEYRKGPMKGMTQQEAQARFEQMWAKAPDAVKEKYAQRDGLASLAPSERAAAGYGPKEGPSAKQVYAGQKQARMAYYDRISGRSTKQATTAGRQAPQAGGAVIDQEPDARRATMAAEAAAREAARQEVQMQADDPQLNQQNPEFKPDRDYNGSSMEPPQTPMSDAQQIGTPEEQARVREMMKEGEDFATADTGDGGMAAAVKLADANAQAVQSGMAANRGTLYSNIGPDGKPKQSPAPAMTLGGSPAASYGQTIIPDRKFSKSPEVGAQLDAKREADNQARAAEYQQKKQADAVALAQSERERLGLPEPVVNKAAPQPVQPGAKPQAGSVNPNAIPSKVGGPGGPENLIPQEAPAPIKNAAPGSMLVGEGDVIPQGMEFTGMRGGKKLYEPMAAVYGGAAAGKTQDQVQTEYQAKMRGSLGLDKPAPLPAPRGPASQADYSVAQESAAYRQSRDSRIADANAAAQKAIAQGRAADAIKTPLSDAAFKQYGTLENMPVSVRYGVNDDGTQMTQKQLPPQVQGITSPIQRRKPTGFAMARRF